MSGPSVKQVAVVRTHLEIPSLDALRAARAPAVAAHLARVHPSAAEYLALYQEVGGPWHWGDRLLWSPAEVGAYLARPDIFVWAVRVGQDTAGFFELRLDSDGHVEIMYFGLAAGFMGRGLGGWMLTRAVQEAFALGAMRVRLHTCTLDAPQALPNYRARGFTILREEHYLADLPG